MRTSLAASEEKVGSCVDSISHTIIMKFSSILSAASFAVAAIASPVPETYVVHEKRASAPTGWQKRDVLDRNSVLPMRFALKQRNLDNAWSYLEEVSHPASEKFGQHWSAAKVAETFSPR